MEQGETQGVKGKLKTSKGKRQPNYARFTRFGLSRREIMLYFFHSIDLKQCLIDQC